MGGIIGGIGALMSGDSIASDASGKISEYVGKGEKMISPWTNQSQTTLDAMNQALGINSQTGVTASSPEYQQLGMDRLKSTANSYDANTIGAGYSASPGYQWQLEQSQKALENSASARAGLLTGATARQEQSNATQLANQNYWQYVTNQQQAMATDYAQRQQQYQNIANESAQNLSAAQSGLGLYGQAIGGTASVANAQMSSAGNAWGQIGGGIGSLFKFA